MPLETEETRLTLVYIFPIADIPSEQTLSHTAVV